MAKKGVSQDKEKGVSEQVSEKEPVLESDLAEEFQEELKGLPQETVDATVQEIRDAGLEPEQFGFEDLGVQVGVGPDAKTITKPAKEPVPAVAPTEPEPAPDFQAQLAEVQKQLEAAKLESDGRLRELQETRRKRQELEQFLAITGQSQQPQYAPQQQVAPAQVPEYPEEPEVLTRAHVQQMIADAAGRLGQHIAAREQHQFVAQHPEFMADVQQHLLPHVAAQPNVKAVWQTLQQLPVTATYEYVQQLKRANEAEAKLRELQGGAAPAASPAKPVPASPQDIPVVMPPGNAPHARGGTVTDANTLAGLAERLGSGELTPADRELLKHSETVDPM